MKRRREERLDVAACPTDSSSDGAASRRSPRDLRRENNSDLQSVIRRGPRTGAHRQRTARPISRRLGVSMSAAVTADSLDEHVDALGGPPRQYVRSGLDAGRRELAGQSIYRALDDEQVRYATPPAPRRCASSPNSRSPSSILEEVSHQVIGRIVSVVPGCAGRAARGRRDQPRRGAQRGELGAARVGGRANAMPNSLHRDLRDAGPTSTRTSRDVGVPGGDDRRCSVRRRSRED